MTRLHTLLGRGLQATAAFWAPLRTAYAWLQRAAQLLANREEHTADAVQEAYTALLAEMGAQRTGVGPLTPAIDQFLKVTASYWSGLFSCYRVPDLPRTNNALEQFFGAARCHERRITGCKRASLSLVIRGSVRLVAAAATCAHPFGAVDLQLSDLSRWQHLRQTLTYRRTARRAQLRFRRDPVAYLAALEAQLSS